MANGNYMANLMREFENADKEQIIENAKDSMAIFANEAGFGDEDANTLFQLLLIGAKTGINSTNGSLNDAEKYIAESVFSPYFNGDIETIYDILSQEVTEEDYTILQQLGQSPVSIYLLKFILAFAYIDGDIDEDAAEQLENCFGVALLGAIFGMTDDDDEMDDSDEYDEKNLDLSEDELCIYQCLKALDDGGGIPDLTYDMVWNKYLELFTDYEIPPVNDFTAWLQAITNKPSIPVSEENFWKILDSLCGEDLVERQESETLLGGKYISYRVN